MVDLSGCGGNFMSDSEDPDETDRKRIVLAMEKAFPESNLDFNNLVKMSNKEMELDLSTITSEEETVELLAAFLGADFEVRG